MSKRFKGGVISKDGASATSFAASGMWNLTRALKEIKAGTWPSGAGLFVFTSFTFQPIVSAGSPTGPTLAQMQSAYSGQTWLSSYFTIGSYQGYQRWTVPATGTYTIECGGGMGGDGLQYYGSNIGTYAYGALISGNFSLTAGNVLEMVIGVKGGSSGGAHGNENGGGGGTFVQNVTTNTLLIVAGGAGGMPSPVYGTSCTRTVSNGHGQSGNSGGYPTTTCYTSVSAATGGAGGNAAGSLHGAAGGGYNSNGANGGTHCSTAIGGLSYGNGLVGGAGNSCYDPTRTNGGFGGGGGGMLGTPGAGGGYSGGSVGGAWSSESTYGGGGGSYNVGTSQINTAGGNFGSLGGSTGAGYCKITKL